MRMVIADTGIGIAPEHWMNLGTSTAWIVDVALSMPEEAGDGGVRTGSWCQWPSVSPHWWPLDSPLVAIVSPRWWPPDLPTGGQHFSPAGVSGVGLGQGLHPLSGGRLR